MAKALLGYVGGPDPRMLTEVRRLQQRVQDLESELLRMQAENDALTAVADEHSLLNSIDLDQRGKLSPESRPVLADRRSSALSRPDKGRSLQGAP